MACEIKQQNSNLIQIFLALHLVFDNLHHNKRDHIIIVQSIYAAYTSNRTKGCCEV